ncbi:MAG: hypothetical protein J2P28_08165 [Actinobacteria bacterium]|nr:hypothetical protein [Actinomycetota bacterium]MBO0835480.1 hypothetical protein [Actinomycetota bacterium]
MHPYIAEALAQDRIAEMHSVAARYRLAKEAAGGAVRAPGKRRRSLLPTGRRQGRVELVWPDGITSVVELSEQSAATTAQGCGLAGSRR